MPATLLVLDIDGTLRPHGEPRVPKENVDALRTCLLYTSRSSRSWRTTGASSVLSYSWRCRTAACAAKGASPSGVVSSFGLPANRRLSLIHIYGMAAFIFHAGQLDIIGIHQPAGADHDPLAVDPAHIAQAVQRFQVFHLAQQLAVIARHAKEDIFQRGIHIGQHGSGVDDGQLNILFAHRLDAAQRNAPFGEKILRRDLQHVHTCLLYTSNTALAFVSLEADGNRTFSFYRKPSADLLYAPEQVDTSLFANAYALHFCSVALVESPMREAHKTAIAAARSAGTIIDFDPNLRFPLWPDRDALRRTVLEFLPLADVVKISDEELEFLTGTSDIEAALPSLFVGHVQLVLYTCGKMCIRDRSCVVL